jgi:exopolysaccharide biosynthesis polyprenyl glycosylphosphotransferase
VIPQRGGVVPSSEFALGTMGQADDRTRAVLEHRRRTMVIRGRGWLMRRMLLAADVVGLVLAFALVETLIGSGGTPDRVTLRDEVVFFAATLPIWLIGAKLFGLYDRDEERADATTSDDLIRVLLLMTVGVFLAERFAQVTAAADPDLTKLTIFWGLAIVLVSCARIAARGLARRSLAYVQNTVVVGAGDVGQLVARKLLHHKEYGLNVVGFVDANPRGQRSDVEQVKVLGGLADLRNLVRIYAVDRVVFAFSNDSHAELLPLVRSLRDMGVQVDVVPRLFEVIGPKISLHTVEGMPLVGLAPVRIPRSARALKRAIDVVGALVCLVVGAPVLALAAVLIKLDSSGPVFFRQRRLGKDMREFTLLKFRTMLVDTDDGPHRAFIAASMDSKAPAEANGIYKLARGDRITRVGRWLRITSVDELPQLLNVLRGEMSLVGPRPCLRYEVENFQPHHFDRFLVPAGLTGLWQVSARSHSTFGEALDLDVLYAQSWSIGLDLALLARTPLQLLRAAATT